MIANITEAQRRALRTAGWLYLLLTLIAPFGLLYIPNTLIVQGDAAATAAQLRASASLLRFGIGSELFHQTIMVFLVMALYRLFRPVDEHQARMLVILGALVSVPIMFLNVVNEIAALVLVSGAQFLSVFPQNQLDALALFFIRLHGQGVDVAAVFWGLWLFPFGILVLRSGFVPRNLGWLLFVAGTAYLVNSFFVLVAPKYANTVSQVAVIFELGELPIVVWLFFAGLRERRRKT